MDYNSFADFSTEFNTMNVIHTPYSGIGRSTLNPFILHYFANEVMKSGTNDAMDVAFAMTCLNRGMAERELILHYISRRLGVELRDASNMELYRRLGSILDKLRGRARHKHDFAGGPQRMIVD
ncbi:hypothetical protein [Marinicrinis lubricantis]|uniref:Uncharacterized protein n=1 Tax=Marinicrinis lubricantis TaxID=2086470 RepID=A0ABW1IS27_9BACL